MVGARTVFLDEAGDGDRYTVLVALTNPSTVVQLLRTARDLAADHDGELLAVSAIHKPVTSPFLLFSPGHIRAEFDEGQPAVLDRATSWAERRGVDLRRHLLVGSDVSEAILTAAKRADADALLLGWQDRPHPSDIVLGATVDRVVARAPCDVFVERVGTTADGVDSILFPTVGGPHVQPAADLVRAVAKANDATVTVVSVVPTAAGVAEKSDAEAHLEDAAERLSDVDCETALETDDDVVGTVVRRAANNDLVVLCATRERSLRRRVVGSVAGGIARQAAPPVVIARRRREPSFLDRVLTR